MGKKTDAGDNGCGSESAQSSGNLIFRLADYTGKKLEAQVALTIGALGKAALAIDLCSDSDLRCWNQLATLATEVLDARLVLSEAMLQWSEVSELEQENLRRESGLLKAMEKYNDISKKFNSLMLISSNF